MKFIWEYVKSFFGSLGKWVVRYPLAAAATVILIVGAVLMLAMGKKFQLGGLLGRLWGKEKKNLRGVPPEDRVDKDGNPIKPGESDDKGYVQAPISDIKKPGLLDDPKTVTVIHPEKGEIVIDLPEGVKNEDVKEVVEIEPDVYEVRNNDTGADTDELLDILGEK